MPQHLFITNMDLFLMNLLTKNFFFYLFFEWPPLRIEFMVKKYFYFI